MRKIILTFGFITSVFLFISCTVMESVTTAISQTATSVEQLATSVNTAYVAVNDIGNTNTTAGNTSSSSNNKSTSNTSNNTTTNISSNTTNSANADTTNNTTVSSPHSNLTMKIQDCRRNGNSVDINLLIQNNGLDISAFDFQMKWTGSSETIDNLGNTYSTTLTIGNDRAIGIMYIRKALPKGVPIKAILQINNVIPEATHLSIIQFHGQTSGGYDSYKPSGFFTLKNIAIQ